MCKTYLWLHPSPRTVLRPLPPTPQAPRRPITSLTGRSQSGPPRYGADLFSPAKQLQSNNIQTEQTNFSSIHLYLLLSNQCDKISLADWQFMSNYPPPPTLFTLLINDHFKNIHFLTSVPQEDDANAPSFETDVKKSPTIVLVYLQMEINSEGVTAK